MTDSMNFGPEWLRNLSCEGSTGGGSGGNTRYQLAEYRYGREEMLTLFEKGLKAPNSLSTFMHLYSEQPLLPLAFTPPAEEERAWQARSAAPAGSNRIGRGGSLERGGRGTRGRGPYQFHSRSMGENSGGWGNGEHPDWSPRKEYNSRASSVDNWRRNRGGDEDDGWRSNNHSSRGSLEKWGRSTSWRGDSNDEKGVPSEKNRGNWMDGRISSRRGWENEDHLPEWATENPSDAGGTFDASGAFHGEDDEEDEQDIKELPLDVEEASPSQRAHSLSPIATKPPEDATLCDINTESNMKVKLKNEKVNEKFINEENKFDELESDTSSTTNDFQESDQSNRVEEDFDRLQEDLVKKLVVDEETPKQNLLENFGLVPMPPAAQPPPNLAPPVLDKWFYQDPQGDLQGPFTPAEMAEWFRAGYFTTSLLVKRQCDERFCMLGDLVHMCGGSNPFQTAIRLAPFKVETPNTENDLLQYHLLQRHIALRQAAAIRLNQNEPWGGLTPLQQRELLTQHPLSNSQITPDMQFYQQQQQQNVSNPLLQMISQLQGNKLPEKSPTSVSSQLDSIQALVQQMGSVQQIPTNFPPSLQPTGLTSNLTNNIPSNFQNVPCVPGPGLPPAVLPNNFSTNLQSSLTGGLPTGGNLPPRPNPLGAVDPLSSSETDPLKSLLRHLQGKPSQPQDMIWQQNQFSTTGNTKQHWQSTGDMPLSLWDLQTNADTNTVPPLSKISQSPPIRTESSEKEHRPKVTKESQEKEQKRKLEFEEKQIKKEAEEKRREEQRKFEIEKKFAEEKQRRDEERVRKELEKAKREAEEKRLRELEEKRRLKEQRKAEEEARKKAEDQRKREEEEEKVRQEEMEREQARKENETSRSESINLMTLPKIAPWSHANLNQGASLADIQKAERERRAEQVALLQQQKLQQMQEQILIIEKPSALQLNWAKKPVEPAKVKSLIEIQAEEQEKLSKQAAAARMAQFKEKEIVSISNTTIPWSGQGLTWASTASQWGNAGGFWNEPPSFEKPSNKPSSVAKSNSTSALNVNKQLTKVKSKIKKEEQQVMKLFNNAPITDEFTAWCTKALANINSTVVDIPTFISFLRDIESALDVREYCKEYLGESPATQQFATQFLEKRRSIKPKATTQKDDMSSPAPAITPSTQHNTDFQEVKGKGKKIKKSKMLKVDSRILGFSVTAAPDRINVGDRDYVDNS